MKSDIDYLIPLMEAKSQIRDVNKFHSSINVIFHDIESRYYDVLHAEMWNSLQVVFSELLNPLKQKIGDKKIKVLDIGCGTGLSSQLLINTKLGQNISDITFLDTSKMMLEQCKKRFCNIKVKTNFIEGDISNIKTKYDLVITNSVLHHIPDLKLFLAKVKSTVETGGYFFHAHDPNGASVQTEIYKKRIMEYQSAIKKQKTNILSKVYFKLKRLINNNTTPNYIEEVNLKLINEGIIREKLTPHEIWSVTDIHVEDLPYSTNNGILISKIKEILYDFKLINSQSYTFFGIMLSELKLKKYVLLEKKFFYEKDIFGRNIAALWKNNSL